MNKEKWMTEVYELLCKAQGAPANDTEKQNLLSWAESIYEQCAADAADCGIEIVTPQEAHDEELSCA